MRFLVAFFVICSFSVLSAQDVDKNLPRKQRTSPLPELFVPDDIESLFEQSDKVLINRLEQLKFLDARNVDRELFIDTAVEISPGLLISDHPELVFELNQYIEQEITFKTMQVIKQKVYQAYRKLGYPVVDIRIPEQEITNGGLEFSVTEGFAGNLKIEGGKYLSKDKKASVIQQQSGEHIDAKMLQNDLDWLNRDSFAGADVLLTPGDAFGSSDIVLALSDEIPVYGYLGYENTGNTATNLDRYFVGGSWGNVFHSGHQISYQYTTSGNPEQLSIHSADYKVRLPWRDEIVVSGIYSNSHITNPLAPIVEDGQSWYLGFRYWTALPSFKEVNHSFKFGFDFKQSNNDIEFGGTTVNSIFDVAQFAGSYDASLKDTWGITEISLDAFYGPGNLTSNNKDGLTTAEADYFYALFNLDRVIYLPEGFLLYGNFTGQMSDSRLTASEQFGVGGFDSVRGYDYREVNGDEGCVVSFELRSPGIHLNDIIGKLPDVGEAQLLAFWDFGYSEINDPLFGEIPKTYASSYGVGVRATLTDYLQASLDYGWQLRNIQSTAGNGRFHASVILTF